MCVCVRAHACVCACVCVRACVFVNTSIKFCISTSTHVDFVYLEVQTLMCMCCILSTYTKRSIHVHILYIQSNLISEHTWGPPNCYSLSVVLANHMD